MKATRIILPILVLLALAAGVASMQSSRTTVDPQDGTSLISEANRNFELNSGLSENVNQQQVVALWGIKDMAEVAARQNALVIQGNALIIQGQDAITSMLRGILVMIFFLLAVVGLLGGVWLKLKLDSTSPGGKVTTHPQANLKAGNSGSDGVSMITCSCGREYNGLRLTKCPVCDLPTGRVPAPNLSP